MDNNGKMPKISMSQNATSKPLKPKILVAGDSIVRDFKGWLMFRNKSVKVHSFSGATTEDMESYLIPLINKKSYHILLYVGTNNLAMDTPEVIVEKLLRLVQTFKVSRILRETPEFDTFSRARSHAWKENSHAFYKKC